MKKQIFALGLISALALISCKKEVTITPSNPTVENSNSAEDVKTTNQVTADLPTKAIETINNFYNQSEIASYEIKNLPVIGKSYEVKFNDGSEIDFDEQGNWHEWKDAKGLPVGVLPASAKDYLGKNYNQTIAVSVEKENDLLQVELANDIDLIFGSSGNFIKIDK